MGSALFVCLAQVPAPSLQTPQFKSNYNTDQLGKYPGMFFNPIFNSDLRGVCMSHQGLPKNHKMVSLDDHLLTLGSRESQTANYKCSVGWFRAEELSPARRMHGLFFSFQRKSNEDVMKPRFRLPGTILVFFVDSRVGVITPSHFFTFQARTSLLLAFMSSSSAHSLWSPSSSCALCYCSKCQVW